MCHCLTLSLHSVTCSCLDLHHKTLKCLKQTVTSDWRRWNQLFVFSPMSISDRISCINPGLRQAMNSATLLHGQGHRHYNNNCHRGTMTEVRCFTKARGVTQGVSSTCLCHRVCECVCVCSGWDVNGEQLIFTDLTADLFHSYSYNISVYIVYP